jgi:hypothetical protein
MQGADQHGCQQARTVYNCFMAVSQWALSARFLKGKEGNSGGARKAGYTAMLCTKSINMVDNDVIKQLWTEYPAVEAPRTVIGTASVNRWHKGGA